jgi:hypothetical protein
MRYAIYIGTGILVVGAGIYLTMRQASAPSAQVFGAPVATQSDSPASSTVAVPQQGSTYSDPSGFSIQLPAGYSARSVTEEGSETLFIERPASAVSAAARFQIYITPYDEPAAQFGITRIKKDLPSFAPKNAREFTITDGHGAEFDDDAGHEIWFAAAGQLYQLTAPADQTAVAEATVASFKLK